MTSIIPPGLAERMKLLREIEDPSVRRSFEKVTRDLRIDEKEVEDLFRAASRDNPFVSGDSTTLRESRDLGRIRDGGSSLLSTMAASKSYDAKLDALKARPHLGVSDDDGGLRSSQVAVDRIAVRGEASGYVYCPPNARCIGAPSTFRVELDGRNFSVHPQTGESAKSVAGRLAAELDKAGYGATVESSRGLAILSIARPSQPDSLKIGEYHQLSGQIAHRNHFGIGGEAPPSGNHLVLDEPKQVNGQTVNELYLRNQDELAEGTRLELNGRLDQGSYGGVETPPRTYLALSGVTNLSAGEPKYDGQQFTSSAGKKLPILAYNRPMLYDAPARIFVLDQGQDRAFLGGMGGMVPPWMNHFHGFRGSAKIENATQADRNAITIDSEGAPTSKASGKKLTHVGQETADPSGPIPFGAPPNWFYDADAGTLYRIDPQLGSSQPHRLAQVIRLPQAV